VHGPIHAIGGDAGAGQHYTCRSSIGWTERGLVGVDTSPPSLLETWIGSSWPRMAAVVRRQSDTVPPGRPSRSGQDLRVTPSLCKGRVYQGLRRDKPWPPRKWTWTTRGPGRPFPGHLLSSVVNRSAGPPAWRRQRFRSARGAMASRSPMTAQPHRVGTDCPPGLALNSVRPGAGTTSPTR
jgi:hypothetical protein